MNVERVNPEHLSLSELGIVGYRGLAKPFINTFVFVTSFLDSHGGKTKGVWHFNAGEETKKTNTQVRRLCWPPNPALSSSGKRVNRNLTTHLHQSIFLF